MRTDAGLELSINRAQWQRLKAILDRALQEETVAARHAILQSACGDDEALLREAESLLGQAEQLINAEADVFEEGAAVTATVLRGESGLPQGRVGAYRLLEETGRGGMGAVYLAERADGCFDKRVAIKIIKRGTDTDEVLRRFNAERHILARLDHPNIARLLDAGTTEDGLPFFVMEYVAGETLVRFADSRRMAVRDRLCLFLKVCSAVEFAHHARVVHRDLKAGNILVTEEGEPKLLDFGIAKLLATELAEEDVTAARQQLLSPACASPEQVRGERATPESDIYALGALLYELLTGRAAHSFSDRVPGPAELTRVICETDRIPPSVATAERQTRDMVRGDLDAIVLQAMARDPGARYPSMAAFSDDIRRFLDGRPVRARRATRAYRVGRFMARNRHSLLRTAAAAAGAILLAVLAGSLIISQPRLRDALRISPASLQIADNGVAVLPFKDLGGGAESAVLNSGVQDQILTDLAKASGLKVISRASVDRYKAEAPRNLGQIGEQLGVRFVLEGRVQRIGQRARVSVMLLDTRNDSQVWSQDYERDLIDVFALQSEIAQAVAAALQVKLLPEEKQTIEQPPTRDLAAYELFLRGKEQVNGYLDAPDQEESLRHAVRLLEEATARDPQFILAYCFMARAHGLLYALRLDKTEARKLLSRAAVDAALRLQPNSPDAHLTLADHYYRCGGGYHRVEEELALARPGLTNSSPFHSLDGSIHRRLGRWAESDRSFTRAVELDPNNTTAINLLADNYVLQRQYEKAIQVYERAHLRGLGSPILKLRAAAAAFAQTADVDRFSAALKEAPADMDIGGGETPQRILVALAQRDYAAARRILAASRRSAFQDVDFTFYYPRSWFEGAIARAEGRMEEARAAFATARVALDEKLKLKPNDPRTLAVLAQVDAALGDKEVALEEARRASTATPLTRDAYDAALILQGLAQVYAWTGEKDLAFATLTDLIRVPGYLSYGYLRVDPSWDPLRGDPRFEAIVASLPR
ncbi:MAG TPA: protein kinase [Chthoniobacterales bacterium]|jgi:serine/threonine protein kinase/tetratricopeptide (TPR) repeat protein|nr:protein kinase [Chthoniobacterales bacterium]